MGHEHRFIPNYMTDEDAGYLGDQAMNDQKDREMEAAERVRKAAPELLAALKVSRQYVKNIHAQLHSASGVHDNLVLPDLTMIDAAINLAEGRS